MSARARDQKISVIIPALDEESSLEPLCRELLGVATDASLDVEIVLVDDGSKDDSWQAMASLADGDDRVMAVRLRRNFGKTAAIAAGVAASSGAVVVLMDADGQDDPAELPRLLDRLTDGVDFVNGYKRPRRDPLGKVLASRVFNALTSFITGLRLRDHNCGLKCVRREVFDEIRLYGNLHRFLPVLAHARGFVVVEEPVHHRPRRFGRSKYGASRLLPGLLDVLMVRFLTDYRGRPQHVLGVLGLFALLVGLGALGYLAVLWSLQFSYPETYKPVGQRPLTLYALGALVVGAQMISLGILAGLLPAATLQTGDLYAVRDVRSSTSKEQRAALKAVSGRS